MTSVGVRELRQRASDLLRLVEQGETVEITDRGRPVALLTPLPTGGPLERLRAAGEVEPATVGLDDLPEPLDLPDVEPPSAVLARLPRRRALMPTTYLDSSALVKLVVAEPESGALRRHLRRRRTLVSSALARTEVLRALLPAGSDAVAVGKQVLGLCELVRINDATLNRAAALMPHELRTLDAIHVATALRLEDDLGALVTYDERLADAARGLGIRVVAPA